jgi:hypothetical protein
MTFVISLEIWFYFFTKWFIFTLEYYTYGVYISQWIRLSKACDSYHDFLDRRLLPKRKLLNQWLLVVTLKSPLREFYNRHHDGHKWPRVCCVCYNHNTPAWLTTGLVARVSRRVTLMEHEPLTLPEYLSSPPGFSGVRVAGSIVFCECFCIFVCPLSFWSLYFLSFMASDYLFGVFKHFSFHTLYLVQTLYKVACLN